MNISPIQLQHYVLSWVCVTPRDEWTLARSQEMHSNATDWNGINIGQTFEFGWGDNQGEDLRAFALRLRITVDNKEGVRAPYDVGLECTGYFRLLGDLSKVNRQDLAQVNGAALLYGNLREVLYSLTARFPLGPMILPAVNFLDLRSKLDKWPLSAAPAENPPSTTRSLPAEGLALTPLPPLLPR
jgi:hypothetical protein